METVKSIIDFVADWRSNHTYITKTDGSLSESSLLDLLVLTRN